MQGSKPPDHTEHHTSDNPTARASSKDAPPMQQQSVGALQREMVFCPVCTFRLPRTEWEASSQDFACPNCEQVKLIAGLYDNTYTCTTNNSKKNT